MEALLAALGALALIPLIFLYSSFSWGFVLFKFWSWFLLPVFPMVPHISIPQAVGLMFLVGLFSRSSSYKYKYKGEEVKSTANWSLILLAPWMTLLVASFVQLFI